MNWKKKEYWLVITLLTTAALYTHLIRAEQVPSEHAVDLSKVPLKIGDWLGQNQLLSQDASTPAARALSMHL